MSRYRDDKWLYISRYIDMEDVVDHPFRTWNKEGLSSNKNISMKIYCMPLPRSIESWNWTNISMNVIESDVRRYPFAPWDKISLSGNKNISIHMFSVSLDNATGHYDTHILSSRVTLDEVSRHCNYCWYRNILSNNSNITSEVMDLYLPNAIGEWNESLLQTRNIYEEEYIPIIDIISRHDILHLYRTRDTRYDYILPIKIVDMLDRVGMSVSNWNTDLDIICQ
jgi:hypothetical protein